MPGDAAPPPRFEERSERYEVVVAHDGVILTRATARLEAAHAEAYLDAVDRAARAAGEPLRVLGVAVPGVRHSLGAERVLAFHRLSVPPAYLAVVGASRVRRAFVRLATHNTLVREVRFFDGEDDALAWLRGLRSA